MVARHLLSSSSLSIERSSITRSTPLSLLFFFLRIRRPPSSPLFPYTTRSRSGGGGGGGGGTRQVCASCGSEHPETDPHARCPACRGLLEIRHDPPPQGGNALRALFDARP